MGSCDTRAGFSPPRYALAFTKEFLKFLGPIARRKSWINFENRRPLDTHMHVCIYVGIYLYYPDDVWTKLDY